jgi:hypothetical protein
MMIGARDNSRQPHACCPRPCSSVCCYGKGVPDGSLTPTSMCCQKVPPWLLIHQSFPPAHHPILVTPFRTTHHA